MYQPKNVKIATNYLPKDRVDTDEIRRKLHPCNLKGVTPNKNKVDSLSFNRMRDISRNFKDGNR